MIVAIERGLLVATLLISACAIDGGESTERVERVGEARQAAATMGRWYSAGQPNRSNRVRYYLDYLPNDALQHYQGTLAALQAYNASTGIRFEPAPVIHLEGGFELPDPEDPEPHVTYFDVGVDGWTSQALSYSSLVSHAEAEDPPGIYTYILDSYGPSGLSIIRPGDPATGRREDAVVAFRPDVSFANLHVPLHETGHVLGLIHEQSRPDRCDFVEYFPGCTDPALQSQFDIAPDALMLSPYDVTSIMQYQSTFACKPDPDGAPGDCLCKTLLYRDPGASPITQPNIDQCTGDPNNTGAEIFTTSQLSHEDINTLYQMYPPVLGQDEAGDNFGAAMAAADFDGDGYDDLAVGAPGEQIANGVKTGVVFLYKGTFTGLMPWRVVGEPGANRLDGDRFGWSLAAVDIDGDHKSELVVGAPRRMVGGERTGAVYVLKGDPTGVVDFVKVTAASAGFASSDPGDWFGETLTVGDFNGDLSPEVVVGAPKAHRVYVIESASWSKYATAFGGLRDAVDQFGASLAAGDLDDDGFDDLAIGAPAADSLRPGRVFYARGKASGFGDVATLEEPGPKVADDRFGRALAIGKLDPLATSQSCLVVGAPGRNNGQGRVFLFDPGLPTGGHHIHSLAELGVPNQPGAGFGGRLLVGQLDAIGGEDLVVGMPFESEPGLPEAGLIAVYHGRRTEAETSRIIPDMLTGTPNAHGDAAPFDHFGSAMAIGDFDHRPITLGDVDSMSLTFTRVADLAVATPTRNGSAGAVWVHQGAPVADPTFPADESVFTGYVAQGDASDPGNLDVYRR